MASFSGLGIGLSLVFGCLLFALVAELYYLLWWKKRSFASEVEDEFTSYAKEFFHLICWKRAAAASSSSSSSLQANNSHRNQEVRNQESDIELGSSKDLLLKSSSGGEDNGVELELMRLHNLAGPPRFLFTIKEETKEDLESEDRSRKGSRTRSLSDLILTVDTPFLTPLPSPPLKAPSPLNPLSSFKHHGFNINPLFESSTDLDLNRLLSSPPPKFRFLREAEEKLYRRLMEESKKKACKNGGSVENSETKSISNPTAPAEEEEEEKEDGFCSTKEKEPQNHYVSVSVSQYSSSSSSSQVLPLASSPPSEHRFNDNVSLDRSL